MARRRLRAIARNEPVRLAGGAAMRRTGPAGAPAVLCLDGGVRLPIPGDWSASLGYLVRRLAPVNPGLAFYEVRYRVRSWKRLAMCVEDAAAALDAIARERTRPVALLGYSMGGAVSVAVAGEPTVTTVVGLAPWLPEGIGIDGLQGRRVAVIHGSVDGRLVGESPAGSRRGVERMRAHGVDASHRVIPGALHVIALPGPGGLLLPLPRAGAWVRVVDEELARFQAAR